jgi:hypothetical protein
MKDSGYEVIYLLSTINGKDMLLKIKVEGVNKVDFGDIFLEDLRSYRENQLGQIGMDVFSRFGKGIHFSWSKILLEKDLTHIHVASMMVIWIIHGAED